MVSTHTARTRDTRARAHTETNTVECTHTPHLSHTHLTRARTRAWFLRSAPDTQGDKTARGDAKYTTCYSCRSTSLRVHSLAELQQHLLDGRQSLPSSLVYSYRTCSSIAPCSLIITPPPTPAPHTPHPCEVELVDPKGQVRGGRAFSGHFVRTRLPQDQVPVAYLFYLISQA